MRCAVIGATGLVGRQLVDQLLADPDCTLLRVFARRPLLSEEPRLDWRVIDFDALADQLDLGGLDTAFCCLGTTTGAAGKAGLEQVDHDHVLAYARAAHAAGVEVFAVVSAVGADPRSPAHYSRVKGRMEAGLRKLGFPCLEILRPSLLLGQRSERRPAEQLGQKVAPLLGPLLRGRLARYRPVAAEDVARELIERARRAEPGAHIRHLPPGA